MVVSQGHGEGEVFGFVLCEARVSVVILSVPSYTRLAAGAGARTPMAGFFVAVFTLLSTFFLLRFLYYLPKAVLGCIISVVVYSILAECPEDVHFFVKMRAWTDLALMMLTFFLTLFVSVQVSRQGECDRGTPPDQAHVVFIH